MTQLLAKTNVLYQPRKRRPEIEHECSPYGLHRAFLLRFQQLERTTTEKNGRRIGHYAWEISTIMKRDEVFPDPQKREDAEAILQELAKQGYTEKREELFWFLTDAGHAYS